MPGIQDVLLSHKLINDGCRLLAGTSRHRRRNIGLEFGQMYRRFGSRVTIVEMGPRLIGREDEDVSEAVRHILEAEGIQVRLNAKCISVAKRNNGLAVGITMRRRSAGSHRHTCSSRSGTYP